MGEAERQRRHRHIGDRLLAASGGEVPDDRVFEIVNQLLVVAMILGACGTALWLWSAGEVGAGAVAAVTAVIGMVGFIGLLAPHLVRLLCGPSHRAVLPGSALLGASLVLLAEHLGHGRILTTDTRDFGAYRWKFTGTSPTAPPSPLRC